MQSLTEYIEKTESAVRKLFEGIDSYCAILQQNPHAVFVTSYAEGEDPQVLYDAWAEQNATALQASIASQHEFLAEGFALATLCGSVLQVAAKAIECYSRNTEIPDGWVTAVGNSKAAVPFCCGRPVRGVPLGLIVYAGRNQHIHFDDLDLHRLNATVFERLACNHGYKSQHPFQDPAFDLTGSRLVSFAANITALIGWRSYESYDRDIRSLIGI
jgi:hypothetical protein